MTVCLALLLGWVINKTNAFIAKAPVRSEIIWENVKEWDSENIQAMVEDFSDWYNIPYLPQLIKCESRFKNVRSDIINDKGEREPSYGIAQIHLPSHPDVSLSEAMDPYLAIKWTVDKINNGEQEMWSCYHKIK